MKISEKQLLKFITNTTSLCNGYMAAAPSSTIESLIFDLKQLISEIYLQQSEELKETDKCQ